MTTDSAGIAEIKEFEGTVLHGYIDKTGHLSCGTGHLVKPGEPYQDHVAITQAVNDSLLHSDLKYSEWVANTYVKVPQKQNQFNSVVSLVFNIGSHAFENSHLLAAINRGAGLQELKPLWLEWNRSGGHVLEDLVGRRAKEFQIYSA